MCYGPPSPALLPQAAHELLGYSKGELRGRQAMVLIPLPFSEKHDRYIKNYISNTSSKVEINVMDYKNQVVMLHKERYLVPCQLQVSCCRQHD